MRSLARTLTLLLATTAVAAALAAPAQAGVPRDFMGMVSEDVLAGDPAYRDAQLAAQRAAGIGLMRQTFRWDEIERAPGQYDFSAHDSYVAALTGHGMRVMPVIFAPPSFRSGAPAGYTDRFVYPPRSNQEMAEFAAVLVRRYGPQGSFWQERPDVPFVPIKSWQVWNEPNLKYYWPGGPNPRQYTRMLAATNAAIKAVDPSAEVVTAGIPDSNKGIALVKFVDGMYKAGARKHFDTLAVNLYGTPEQMLDAALRVRRTMNARRDKSGDMRATELGWATQGPRGKYTVGRKEQARRLKAVVRGFVKQRSKLGMRGLVYFNWKDLPPYQGRTDFWGLNTGLLDASGQPKLAYFTLLGLVDSVLRR